MLCVSLVAQATSTFSKGMFADRFVKTIKLTTATTEPAHSLVYGNADYGYYEVTELSRVGATYSARILPPGFRSPIDFYLKKLRPDGTMFYEKVDSQKFDFPLGSDVLTPQPLPEAEKFTSRYFLGAGRVPRCNVVYAVNRFAEIVWVYGHPVYKIKNYNPNRLGGGKYAYLHIDGDFQVFNFDGTIERQVKFPEATNHDFIFDGQDSVVTLGHETVDFPGKPGSSLKPGSYLIGRIVNLNLATGEVQPLWSAFDEIVRLIGPEPAPPHRAEPDIDELNTLQHLPGKGYLVSARHVDTVLFLDESFRVLWSLGSSYGATISTVGTRYEFDGQHHVTVLPNGNLLMVDNGKVTSRFLELSVDPVARAVTLVQEFLPQPPIWGRTRGSAFRLPNGNTVTHLNTTRMALETQYVIEFDAAGNQIAKMKIDNTVLGEGYRMQPVDTIANETYLGPSL
jgi:hypothetical protein